MLLHKGARRDVAREGRDDLRGGVGEAQARVARVIVLLRVDARVELLAHEARPVGILLDRLALLALEDLAVVVGEGDRRRVERRVAPEGEGAAAASQAALIPRANRAHLQRAKHLLLPMEGPLRDEDRLLLVLVIGAHGLRGEQLVVLGLFVAAGGFVAFLQPV